VEFRVLGPLELLEDGRAVELPAGKPRALLGLLLLEAGSVVSVDRIIESLWGSHGPATAPKVVQGYVSRLRKLLPAGALERKGPGYLLAVDPERVDLGRFERLRREGAAALREGRNAVAAATLSEALALWRGPPLADVADELELPGEPARLEEIRVAVVEDRLEAELALGKGAELVAELEALVAANPLRERLRGQLMLALYRAGRQTEAAAVYRDTRAALAELGIEPGPTLRQLER
jgi:DNA-binding SARP family transcriptional activator